MSAGAWIAARTRLINSSSNTKSHCPDQRHYDSTPPLPWQRERMKVRVCLFVASSETRFPDPLTSILSPQAGRSAGICRLVCMPHQNLCSIPIHSGFTRFLDSLRASCGGRIQDVVTRFHQNAQLLLIVLVLMLVIETGQRSGNAQLRKYSRAGAHVQCPTRNVGSS